MAATPKPNSSIPFYLVVVSYTILLAIFLNTARHEQQCRRELSQHHFKQAE